MGELELLLLDYYRHKEPGTHTTQELYEWLWLEVKIGLEKWERRKAGEL